MSTQQRPRTASERLADYVVDLRFEDLPTDVVDKAKDLLVHHLGLAFQGHASPSGQHAVAAARELSGPYGDYSVIGEQRRVGLLDAVFANSALMNHAGMDDFSLGGKDPTGIHQGVMTWPVALAAGERQVVSGKDFLAAVVSGYDCLAKLAMTGWTWNLSSPRRANCMFASFAAAAVAARLLNLSREHAAHAMAHAAHLGMGLIQGIEYTLAYIHGLIARNGMTAAVLAQAGMPMTRTMIDGEYGLFHSHFGQVPDALERNLSTLGTEFEILKTSDKRYRGSGLNIVPSELTLGLVTSRGITADDVAAVEITVPKEREQRESVMEALLEQPDGNVVTRVASLRFLVASILASGKIDPSRYAQPGREAELADLLGKIRPLQFEPDRPIRYGRIEITTKTGDQLMAEGDSYEFPRPSWTETLSTGSGLLTPEQLRRLVELIDGLETFSDVSELVACLVPDRPAD